MQKFGEKLGGFLHLLRNGGPATAIEDRGRPLALLVERSCPPTSDLAAVRGLIATLACQLEQRLAEERRTHARLPCAFRISWRQSYDNMRSKSGRLPSGLLAALARGAGDPALCAAAAPAQGEAGRCEEWVKQSGGESGAGGGAARLLEEAGVSLLQGAGLSTPWQITRVALACPMQDSSSKCGQMSLSSFLAKSSPEGPAGAGARSGARGGGGDGGEATRHAGQSRVDSGGNHLERPLARPAAAAQMPAAHGNPAQPVHPTARGGSGKSKAAAGSVYDEGLAQLQQMGFGGAEVTLRALRQAKGSVAAATELLLSIPCPTSPAAPLCSAASGKGCGVKRQARAGRGRGKVLRGQRGQPLIASFLAKPG